MWSHIERMFYASALAFAFAFFCSQVRACGEAEMLMKTVRNALIVECVKRHRPDECERLVK